MTTFTQLTLTSPDPPEPFTDRLRLGVAAYLARFKPSTVSRRLSVAAGFHRICVLDGLLEHSSAEYVRCLAVPAESPTLRFRGSDPAQPSRRPNGPARSYPAPAPVRRDGGIQVARAHPHMLPHTFVTTMLDAGVDLRDVQIAARHADPRTTMRYAEVSMLLISEIIGLGAWNAADRAF